VCLYRCASDSPVVCIVESQYCGGGSAAEYIRQRTMYVFNFCYICEIKIYLVHYSKFAFQLEICVLQCIMCADRYMGFLCPIKYKYLN